MLADRKEKRGMKRKREAAPPEEALTTRLTGKLHHGLREVRKAAKKAKIFEVQKLVKRLKSLRAKDPAADAIAGLEAELEALKHVDHEPVAKSALKSKLKKDRILASNTHAQAAIAAELTTDLLTPSAAGTPAARVESRLLSSKTLAAEVHAVVDSLKEVIVPTKKAKKEAQTEEKEGDGEDDDDNADVERPAKAKKRESAAKLHVEAADDSDAEVDDAGWESGSIHGENEDEDQPADDGWESGSVDGGRPGGTALLGDESSDEDEDEDPSASDSEVQPPPRKVAKPSTATHDAKGKSKATSAESTFLPSLSVGFTRGDSDASDLSDSEAKAADNGRKNRRGQRARRAIWEKKYGRNANHVKKEHETTAQNPRQKGAGWNQKGGPRNAGPPGRRGPPPSQVRPNVPHQGHASEGRPQPRPTKTEVQDKPLHPSWEAKKRLKEKQNPTIMAPQGKKITFS
ncbi:hypothetical protein CERSUDRAFT_112194 [Gelatoporia subvermispora B]|uniref:Bud22 domain-containing protein n=1 Tax=Ceriporiopsis subvermispora (strain B) TaxID=914234 RepID=M2QSF6_CERS8|nr:hypothetical protein CERSUDRAFT_112194 [Gelatoporia subvermispora B]